MTFKRSRHHSDIVTFNLDPCVHLCELIISYRYASFHINEDIQYFVMKYTNFPEILPFVTYILNKTNEDPYALFCSQLSSDLFGQLTYYNGSVIRPSLMYRQKAWIRTHLRANPRHPFYLGQSDLLSGLLLFIL